MFWIVLTLWVLFITATLWLVMRLAALELLTEKQEQPIITTTTRGEGNE